jgi:hypothetical protein
MIPEKTLGLWQDHKFNPAAGPYYLIRPQDDVIREDGPGGVLLVHEEDEHKLHVTWALLESVGADRYQLVAHGAGPSGNLREPRHTFFGHEADGYVFYVRPKLLAWGFKILERWFDFDG